MITQDDNSRPAVETAADAEFMRHAIRLAQLARERGDAPVGSVIVRDGRIIAEGIESVRADKDLAAHAEVRAVEEACRSLNDLDLTGCTLFTTVEPCFMCSFIIRSAHISRAVIDKAAPHIGGFSSNYPILADPNIPGWFRPPLIVTGLLEEECYGQTTNRRAWTMICLGDWEPLVRTKQ